ncbi:hypothetical protein LK07_21060 [Streptomyces pluripotens]|uniref:Uncharacterized protein n=1 Tax=Streptomyces pluripotens TaxID=1355015 RepID=A0A221P1N7_9ACTN|nr:hypothetical protein LK06_019900 [Streptomyces pluripotens]ASN26087.1 hypothetical protein LK07_21060 [Streptomyces pluripotens]KIE26252.1 hypothetical protein LK08_13605 [Streptomyces sp. MUSC 125]
MPLEKFVNFFTRNSALVGDWKALIDPSGGQRAPRESSRESYARASRVSGEGFVEMLRKGSKGPDGQLTRY